MAAGQFVHVSRDAGEENKVDCRVTGVHVLGAMTTVICRPVASPSDLIHVEIATSEVRMLSLQPDGRIAVRIQPEGVHIMPRRERKAAVAVLRRPGLPL
jgi:hypothetical protein